MLYRNGLEDTVQKQAPTSQRSLRNTGIHNRERIQSHKCMFFLATNKITAVKTVLLPVAHA